MRNDCIRRNLEILSGAAGDQVLENYTAYFDYSGDVWEDWRMQPYDKYRTCLDIICVMQDAEYRLVFKLAMPKFDILEVCKIPEGSNFDFKAVVDIATPLLEKHRICCDCVDRTFTQVWAHRLSRMGRASCRRAHTHLCDLVSVLRVTSSKVRGLQGQRV